MLSVLEKQTVAAKSGGGIVTSLDNAINQMKAKNKISWGKTIVKKVKALCKITNVKLEKGGIQDRLKSVNKLIEKKNKDKKEKNEVINWGEKIKKLVKKINLNIDVQIEKQGGIFESLNHAQNLIKRGNVQKKAKNKKVEWDKKIKNVIKELSKKVNLKIEKEGGIFESLNHANNLIKNGNVQKIAKNQNLE